MCHINTSKKVKCEYCEFESILPEMMTKHIKTEHNTEIDLETYDEMQCTSDDQAEDIIDVKDAEKEITIIKCNECSYECALQVDLETHRKLEHIYAEHSTEKAFTE